MSAAIQNSAKLLRKVPHSGEVPKPVAHILQVPGKKVRSKLCEALNHWLRIPQDKLERIEEILEELHNASLLIDDIQDFSVLRRGIPAAHLIYGIPRTLSSALFTAFDVFEKAMALHPEGVRICTEQVLELYRGQGMDVYWRDNLICPTEEEYKEMCIRKTGGIFLLAVRLMQLFSEVKEDFTNFGTKLGLFFQIRDDYMNLMSDEYSQQKTYCEDLSEGKFSFPMIHAIRSHPEDKTLINIIKQKPKDYKTKKYCVSLMKKFGSLAYTKRVLLDLKEEIVKEMNGLPKNRYMTNILDHVLKLED